MPERDQLAECAKPGLGDPDRGLRAIRKVALFERLAEARAAYTQLGKLCDRQSAPCGVGGLDQMRLSARGPSARLRELELAARQASERTEMRGDAERHPEVTRQSSYVITLRHAKFQGKPSWFACHDAERCDLHGAVRELGCLARARQSVGTPAFDLDRADRRRRLLQPLSLDRQGRLERRAAQDLRRNEGFARGRAVGIV
jgi:hypothetical protein